MGKPVQGIRFDKCVSVEETYSIDPGFVIPAHIDWGIVVSCAFRAAAAWMAVGIMLVGVPQPKSMHGFSPNFKVMYHHKDLELIRFWRVSGNNCCHDNTKYFWVLDFGVFKFVVIPQPKPILSGSNCCHGNTYKMFWFFTIFSGYVNQNRI